MEVPCSPVALRSYNMLVNYQRLIHGVPFGPWEPPSADSLIKADSHVRGALATVAYLRALERAGTSISSGNSVPPEQLPALFSPFSWRAASGSGNQSTNHNITLQGAGSGTLHGDRRTPDGMPIPDGQMAMRSIVPLLGTTTPSRGAEQLRKQALPMQKERASSVVRSTCVRSESARDESEASEGNESLTSSTMPTRGNMSVLRVRGSGDSPYSQAYNLHYRGKQPVNRARSASPFGRSQAHRAGQVHSQPLHHHLPSRARLETPTSTTTRQQEAEGSRILYGEPSQQVNMNQTYAPAPDLRHKSGPLGMSTATDVGAIRTLGDLLPTIAAVDRLLGIYPNLGNSICALRTTQGVVREQTTALGVERATKILSHISQQLTTRADESLPTAVPGYGKKLRKLCKYYIGEATKLSLPFESRTSSGNGEHILYQRIGDLMAALAILSITTAFRVEILTEAGSDYLDKYDRRKQSHPNETYVVSSVTLAKGGLFKDQAVGDLAELPAEQRRAQQLRCVLETSRVAWDSQTLQRQAVRLAEAKRAQDERDVADEARAAHLKLQKENADRTLKEAMASEEAKCKRQQQTKELYAAWELADAEQAKLSSLPSSSYHAHDLHQRQFASGTMAPILTLKDVRMLAIGERPGWVPVNVSVTELLGDDVMGPALKALITNDKGYAWYQPEDINEDTVNFDYMRAYKLNHARGPEGSVYWQIGFNTLADANKVAARIGQRLNRGKFEFRLGNITFCCAEPQPMLALDDMRYPTFDRKGLIADSAIDVWQSDKHGEGPLQMQKNGELFFTLKNLLTRWKLSPIIKTHQAPGTLPRPPAPVLDTRNALVLRLLQGQPATEDETAIVMAHYAMTLKQHILDNGIRSNSTTGSNTTVVPEPATTVGADSSQQPVLQPPVRNTSDEEMDVIVADIASSEGTANTVPESFSTDAHHGLGKRKNHDSTTPSREDALDVICTNAPRPSYGSSMDTGANDVLPVTTDLSGAHLSGSDTPCLSTPVGVEDLKTSLLLPKVNGSKKSPNPLTDLRPGMVFEDSKSGLKTRYFSKAELQDTLANDDMAQHNIIRAGDDSRQLEDLVSILSPIPNDILAARGMSNLLSLSEAAEEGMCWRSANEGGNKLVLSTKITCVGYNSYSLSTAKHHNSKAQAKNTLVCDRKAIDELQRRAEKYQREDGHTVEHVGTLSATQPLKAFVISASHFIAKMEAIAGRPMHHFHCPNSANRHAQFSWHTDDHAEEKDKKYFRSAKAGRAASRVHADYLETTSVIQLSPGKASMGIAGLDELDYPGEGGMITFASWYIHRTLTVEPEGLDMWKMAGFFKEDPKLEPTAVTPNISKDQDCFVRAMLTVVNIPKGLPVPDTSEVTNYMEENKVLHLRGRPFNAHHQREFLANLGRNVMGVGWIDPSTQTLTTYHPPLHMVPLTSQVYVPLLLMGGNHCAPLEDSMGEMVGLLTLQDLCSLAHKYQYAVIFGDQETELPTVGASPDTPIGWELADTTCEPAAFVISHHEIITSKGPFTCYHHHSPANCNR